MNDSFDKDYWEAHWDRGVERPIAPPHPALAAELSASVAGTALDAGCGEGAEAIWLASNGWKTTAADISARALDVARERAGAAGVDVEWIQADLSAWSPESPFDLVTTFYAHPTIPQLEFYDRIGQWVRPGGTLLIVGHLQAEHGHAHETPAEASVTPDSVATRLMGAGWSIHTAGVRERTLVDRPLHDVVVLATKPR